MKSILVIVQLIIAQGVFAQTGVKWKYSVNKLPGNFFEVHMTAYVNRPWHIYSQHMEEGGPLPTSIRFDANPALEVVGAVREAGQAITRHESVFNMDVRYYMDSVDFVQKVAIRKPFTSGDAGGPDTMRVAGVGPPVRVAGSINFMICKEDQCLAPTLVRFTVQLE